MAIIDSMKLKHRVMFLCLYHAGLRKSEACSLEPKDIHFNPDYIVAHGKGGEMRLVAMSDLLADNMKTYLKTHEDSLLFPSRIKSKNGKIREARLITDIRSPLKTAMKKPVLKEGLLRTCLDIHLLRTCLKKELTCEQFKRQWGMRI
jgi:site-specific recombinase XerD